MNKLWTVIRFTFMNRLKTKSFLVTTLIFMIGLSVMVNLPYVISLFSKSEVESIGIIDKGSDIPQALQHYFAMQDDPAYKITLIDDAQADETKARAMVEEGQIEGYLVLLPEQVDGFPKVLYKGKDQVGFAGESQLQSALFYLKQEKVLSETGLSKEELEMLTAPVSFESIQLFRAEGGQEGGKTEADVMSAYILVYVMLFLLYMGVISYGNIVATEVTTEKSSRVMELLITSVSPLKQMFGKIIGICLLGFLQVALYLAAMLINAALPHNRDMLSQLDINVFASGGGLFIYFLVFFILGYLIYATLFAGVGSLVSRTEEVGQAVMPMMILVIAAFMIAMFGLQAPNAGFIVAMSYVPFFSPLIMFLRIGMSDPAWWEIAISLGLLVLSVLLCGWLSAKIYRTGVLMYGKRPSLKELVKAMKAYKV